MRSPAFTPIRSPLNLPFFPLPSGRFQAVGLCLLLVTIVLFPRFVQAADAKQASEKKPFFFEDSVGEILSQHCFDCHDQETREGHLDLTTTEGLLKGSESGPVVNAGNSDHSLLYEVVKDGEMPPDGPRLSSQEVETIREWISAGARFRVPPKVAAKPLSQHDILPILLLRCVTCHGAELQRGGLDLRSIASLKAGGEHGPVAVSGDADASLMIQRIEQELCPPHGELLNYFVERPGSNEVEKLRRWIDEGLNVAPQPEDVVSGLPDPHVTDSDREHWAFQPLPKSVEVPLFPGVDLPQPIDAFIYQRLHENGLDFSPPATRHQLIRRVYFDLIGMPPTRQELTRWEKQTGNWYEELVDELLASPHYGERWGRYWLDVAGYADSEGGTASDPIRDAAWKYRDYVIRSLNADKPWDRFLLEQIAGDELADYRDPEQVTDEIVDNLIATGFLRMSVDQTGSRTMNFVPERLGLISDSLAVVSSGVMALTMGCARCHSHKYDPIPQSDYYRFKAIFQGAYDEHDWMSWKTRTLEVATPESIAKRKSVNGPLNKEIKALKAQEKKLIKTWQDRTYAKAWPKLEPALQKEIMAAVKIRRKRPTPQQKELIARYDNEIRPTEAVLIKRYPEFAKEIKKIKQEIKEKRGQLIPSPKIRALWDRGRPSPAYLLIRGEYNRPGRPVGPGVPSVLMASDRPFVVEPPWPGAPSTGRRLAFARWLIEPDHPLTSRVLVNRIWSRHFGRGIVKTVDNFGALGEDPSHPELLNWLARNFIDQGWSLKSLHRMILLSRTYRQTSGAHLLEMPEATESERAAAHQQEARRRQIDPENALLSRMPLMRLNAEALRDALLVVSGACDDRLYGPPTPIIARDDGLITEEESSPGQFRRSIYLQLRRTELPTLLTSFDYPEMQPNCTQRPVSTVATQSLVMMNNAGVHKLSEQFAQNVLDQSDEDPTVVVDLAYRSAFSRPPTDEERSLGDRSLSLLKQRWIESGAAAEDAFRLALTTYCHTLLNSAEFSYID